MEILDNNGDACDFKDVKVKVTNYCLDLKLSDFLSEDEYKSLSREEVSVIINKKLDEQKPQRSVLVHVVDRW